ncbi:MAG: alcohol dehydrogenase catalytic domain-containing protein [Trebonia sp.]
MRAVVLGDTPWSLRVADGWPEPELGSGQVMVRVHGVGICGSDLSLITHERRAPGYPWVLGHEAFGEIVAAGDGVDPARAGQRVVIEPNYPCLRCPACRAGLTSMCPDRVLVGFNAPGLLTEYAAVPAAFAWPVPCHWSDGDAVCAEPLTVALAAIRRSGMRTDGNCLVIGAGSQGGLLCLALAAHGVTPHVLEPNEGRLQLAVSLGAKAAGPGGTEFQTIFETSGAEAALGEAIRRAAPGADVVLIGLGGQATRVDTRMVVRRQLVLRGSLIYDHPGDFRATLASAIPAPERILRAAYPLREAPEAFRAALAIPGKTWIRVAS